MLRIRLSGDHSAYHCGSAAAFEVIAAEARRHGEVVTEGDYDLLLVNGEGSMHHGNGACAKKMAQIEAALAQGKRVALVNTVWQDNPDRFARIVRGCESVVVREVMSQRELAQHGVHAAVHVDQSYFRVIDSDPYVDYGGAAVMTDFYAEDFGGFVRLNSRWARQHPFVDMQAVSWSSLVRSLRTASLLVTGRHHAVYAACKARVPFLALRGNTHKVEGLIRTAGADIPVFDSVAELRKHLAWPGEHLAAYDRLFDWMASQRPWSLELAPASTAGAAAARPGLLRRLLRR
jgi:hypothetical protein